ncbi:tetratricopeptide repeat protein [Mucilaginibacter sp. HMF5004]|uniref:tetratricopeptide repeat protein n=1 Tax=Mucilaginibacter rivuli TaxID=2857527 RepID=UPI001C5CD645|nr:tetratricopeptide repeat protein [Mucilaginibacter rivuli]MBW4888759.1 tetratricopeptide repeat protein [Mucilaginibacter rivuli]
MKILNKLVCTLVAGCLLSLPVIAQNTDEATDMVKQGIALHNQGKYAEAIAKFNEVLKTDPAHAYANYEMGFSLYVSKKGKDAIPYLEKAIKSPGGNISAGAYALLASIYDEANDTKKAVDMYREVIRINPNYPQVYYNFGLTYFRNGQYQAAESCAIEAITQNPKNASSQRLYALVNFHQNKRMNALLGLCSFLLLEPTGPRAAEAYSNIQHILQGGVLAEDKRDTTLALSTEDEKEMKVFNVGIQLTTSSAKAKNLSGADQLEFEFKNIIAFAAAQSEKKTDFTKTFFDKFFVDYLNKLALSNSMPAFAHSVAAIKDSREATWVKANPDQVTALAEWIKTTDRPL